MAIKDWLEKERRQITLTVERWRRLELWAALKGRTAVAMAAHILIDRIDANKDVIDDGISEIARLEGKTVEEVEQYLLSSDKNGEE